MPIDAPAFREFIVASPEITRALGHALPATKCRACHDYHPATVDCLRPVTVQQRRRWRWVLVGVILLVVLWRVA